MCFLYKQATLFHNFSIHSPRRTLFSRNNNISLLVIQSYLPVDLLIKRWVHWCGSCENSSWFVKDEWYWFSLHFLHYLLSLTSTLINPVCQCFSSEQDNASIGMFFFCLRCQIYMVFRFTIWNNWRFSVMEYKHIESVSQNLCSAYTCLWQMHFTLKWISFSHLNTILFVQNFELTEHNISIASIPKKNRCIQATNMQTSQPYILISNGIFCVYVTM